MNFEEFCKLYKKENTWANLSESPDAPLPPLPFTKKPKVKRMINSVPLGTKK